VHVHVHVHVPCLAPVHIPRTPRARHVQVLRLAAQATDGSPLSALGMLGKGHRVQTTSGHGVQTSGQTTSGIKAPHPSSLAGVPAAPTGTGGAARPLLLTVQRVVLRSWVVELQAVQALHVVVRGELVSGTQGSTQGPRAPLMLRSATQRKRGATLELNLSAMLVGEASCVEIELLHEPLSSGTSHVLGSAQLELGRLYQSTAAQPLQYELPLYDARAMHVATLQLLSQPHAKLALAPPPPAAVSLAAVAASGAQAAAVPPAPAAVVGGAVAAPAASEVAVAAQVQVLEAELAQARQRAEGLQRENLRLAQRSHTQLQHGAGGGSVDQGRHGAGGGARGGPRMDPTDWRKAELDSLERSLARLQRHTGLQASSSMPGLEIAKIEMARMVEEAAGGRGAQGAALELGVQGAMGVQQGAMGVQQGAMLTV
jgi:hypothetical protein